MIYFFYNIAQDNTKLLQRKSGGKFSVFTLSYVNTALNQSAFRIHKCYIIKYFVALHLVFKGLGVISVRKQVLCNYMSFSLQDVIVKKVLEKNLYSGISKCSC